MGCNKGINPLDLVRKAVQFELGAQPSGTHESKKAFEKRLEDTLIDWQNTVDYVSFATAFEISRGTVITKSVNPLKTNDTTIFNDVFLPLTSQPGDVNRGKWPWKLARENELEGLGCFSPQLVLIHDSTTSATRNNYPDYHRKPINSTVENNLPHDANSLNDKLNNIFDNQENVEVNSWRAYGVLPALLGDELRNAAKKTRMIVYLLGTRKEFVSKWHEEDWGMMVGFTAEARDAGGEVHGAILDALVASWNVLAVAPFAIAHKSRIMELDAQQRATHIFKTAVQKMKDSLDGHFKTTSDSAIIAWNAAKPKVEGFESLINLSYFLAKGGLNGPDFIRGTDGIAPADNIKGISAIRSQDYESQEYDIISEIMEYFVNKPHGTDFNIECSTESTNGKWIKKIYLTAVLDELTRNIIEHRRENLDKIPDCVISISDDMLHVTITNTLSVDDAKRVLYERGYISTMNIELSESIITSQHTRIDYTMPTGEAAATAFASCLGGTYIGKVIKTDDKNSAPYAYSAEITYHLTDWKKAIERINEPPPTATDDEKEPVKFPESMPEPTGTPEEKNVAIRVLLLDDNMAEPQSAYNGFFNLKNDNATLLPYTRTFSPTTPGTKIKEKEFGCLGLWKDDKYLGIEIVLCTRLHFAKDYLATVHFDILLVDVDFGMEPGAPKLGGILFALIPRPHSVVRIMTALDSKLREDSLDYRYLLDLQGIKYGTSTRSILGHLEIDTEQGSKDLSKQFRLALLDWFELHFPKRVDPVIAFAWGQALMGNKPAIDVKIMPYSHFNKEFPTLSGQTIRSVFNEENNGDAVNDKIKYMANNMMARPTAICDVFDGKNHYYKVKYIATYAYGIACDNNDYLVWKKNVDNLLMSNNIDHTTFKHKARDGLNCNQYNNDCLFCPNKYNHKIIVDALFRHKYDVICNKSHNTNSMYIYDLINDNIINYFNDHVNKLVGETKSALRLAPKYEISYYSYFDGLLLFAGRINDGNSATGGDTPQSLEFLRRHVSICEIWSGNNIPANIPECHRNDIFSIINNNADSLFLLLMMQRYTIIDCT